MPNEIKTADIVEVKKNLTTLLTEDNDIKKILTHSISETVISTYNSSLPKAEELEKLEKLRPGITNDFVEMMKSNLANEIEYDQKALALEDKRMETINKEAEREHTTIRLGQVIGGVIALSVLGLSYLLISTGEFSTAVALIGVAGALGIAASAFTGNKVDDSSNSVNE